MNNKINKNEERCYVVYKHTSPSNKVYIGVTCQNPPEKRWANGKGYNDNKHFSRAISKYGWQNFLHEILFAGLTKEQAIEKEIELIAKYNATNRDYGYNIALGGNSVGELPEEQRRKISEAGKIPILQYTKSLEFIKRWDSVTSASNEVGVSTSCISACCRGNIGLAGGFVWRYEFPELIKNPKGHTNPDTYKPVDQYSARGEFIATYIHMSEASEKTGIDDSTISKCCKGEQRKTGGCIWRYHGEELTQEYIDWCNGTGREDARVSVIQYSMSGELIKIWESINSIIKELEYDGSAIIRCCKNEQKSSYGFIWCYADEELTEERIKWCNSSDKKRMIIQYSLNGEFIKIYDSVTDACNAVEGKSTSAISKCCKHEKKTAYGYIWRYASDIQETAPHLVLAPTLSEAV